jgi:hypothetical protein
MNQRQIFGLWQTIRANEPAGSSARPIAHFGWTVALLSIARPDGTIAGSLTDCGRALKLGNPTTLNALRSLRKLGLVDWTDRGPQPVVDLRLTALVMEAIS